MALAIAILPHLVVFKHGFGPLVEPSVVTRMEINLGNLCILMELILVQSMIMFLVDQGKTYSVCQLTLVIHHSTKARES